MDRILSGGRLKERMDCSLSGRDYTSVGKGHKANCKDRKAKDKMLVDKDHKAMDNKFRKAHSKDRSN